MSTYNYRFNGDKLIRNRQVRIFLSSTFSDLLEDREALVKIFDILKLKAAKRDIHLSIVDLRWGITEEDAQNGKVISLCLEEIERSHPFFIGILGNNYGTTPTRDEFEKNPELRERYPWLDTAISNDTNNSMSITEMEIQHGVLNNNDNVEAIFFFKNTSKPDNDKRLTELKEKIKEKYIPIEYTKTSELCYYVNDIVSNIINKHFPNIDSMSALDKIRMTQKAYLNSRHFLYIPRCDDYNINDFILSQKQCLVLVGESGVGKSALLANWIIQNNDNPTYHLIYHFVGNVFSENTWYSVLRHICDEICDLYMLDKSAFTLDSVEEDIIAAFSKILTCNKKLVVVIDGVNLINSHANDKLLRWLPSKNSNVKFIFSTHEDDEMITLLRRQFGSEKKYMENNVRPLIEDECVVLISQYLSIYGKKLTEKQILHISRCPMFHNPLILRTLLDELLHFGSHKELDQLIEYYMSAAPDSKILHQKLNQFKDNLPEYKKNFNEIYLTSNYSFFNLLLKRFENNYSVNLDLVRHVLTLISVSECGLSENEIISILKCQSIEWHLFFCAFYNNFLIHNGIISFSNKIIRDTVNERYKIHYHQTQSYAEEMVINCRREIISYCSAQNTYRNLKELAFQFYMLNEWNSLYEILSPVDNFLKFYSDYDLLVKYWLVLRTYGYDTYIYMHQLLKIEYDDRISFVLKLVQLSVSVTDLELMDSCTKELMMQSHNLNGIDYMEILIKRADYMLASCLKNKFEISRVCKLTKFLYKRAIDIARDNDINDFIAKQRLLKLYYEAFQNGLPIDTDEMLIMSDELCVTSALVFGSESYEYTTFLTQRGLIAHKMGKYDIALSDLSKAHENYEILRGKSSIDYAMSLQNLGLLYTDIDNFKNGFNFLGQALEIVVCLLGDSPNIHKATILGNLSYLYSKKDDREKSFYYQKKALDDYFMLFGKDSKHILIAECYWNMSYDKEQLNDFEEAFQYAYKYHEIACILYDRYDYHIQESLYRLNELSSKCKIHNTR